MQHNSCAGCHWLRVSSGQPVSSMSSPGSQPNSVGSNGSIIVHLPSFLFFAFICKWGIFIRLFHIFAYILRAYLAYIKLNICAYVLDPGTILGMSACLNFGILIDSLPDQERIPIPNSAVLNEIKSWQLICLAARFKFKSNFEPLFIIWESFPKAVQEGNQRLFVQTWSQWPNTCGRASNIIHSTVLAGKMPSKMNREFDLLFKYFRLCGVWTYIVYQNLKLTQPNVSL